jgi:hypothetical protein
MHKYRLLPNKQLKHGFVLNIIFGALLCVCPNSYGANLAYIDTLLHSPDFHSHQYAVDLLTNNSHVDTVMATSILINSLKEEFENPTSNQMAVGSYFTITQFIQYQYMVGLQRLGNTSRDSINQRLINTNGAFKERLILTMGLMGDTGVHSLLKPLYHNSTDPFTRYIAILALSGFKDANDIPIFLNAINDEYYVIKSGYVRDTERTRDYIIRAVSACALMDLGYKLKRKGNAYIVILAPPK